MIKLLTPLTQVDSSAAFTLGTRTATKDGNEYIYLPGTTSVAQYDVVTFLTAATVQGVNSYGSVTRLATTGGVGPVAVAQAAIISNKYGWFQTKGITWANAGVGCTVSLPCYASGTAGLIGSGVVSGDLLAGMYFLQAGAPGGTVKVLMNDPFCTDTLS